MEDEPLNDDRTLTLWSFMPVAAWETLVRDGHLRGDGRRADRDLREHYPWMMEQMRKRIPGYRSGFPVWAWYRPKQRVRDRKWSYGMEAGVLVKFDAPAGKVLLSDFDAWHSVLNRHYLALSRRENERRDRLEQQATGLRFPHYDDLPPVLQAQVRVSWERIFDLKRVAASDWTGGASQQYIQAVLEEIRLEWVVKVRRFRATGP